MNKTELIDTVAKDSSLARTDAAKAVESILRSRNWLMLHAIGVRASVFDATAVLIAVSVLSVLPIGPGVGAGAMVLILGAGAMVLILGASGVASVSAAGVLLTATGTLGALAYAGWALADRLWTNEAPVAGLAPPAKAPRALALP